MNLRKKVTISEASRVSPINPPSHHASIRANNKGVELLPIDLFTSICIDQADLSYKVRA
jgi:hypothetical protein